VESVANMLWSGWPSWRGIGGHLTVEWLANMLWNQWPSWCGMTGQHAVESAQGEQATA